MSDKMSEVEAAKKAVLGEHLAGECGICNTPVYSFGGTIVHAHNIPPSAVPHDATLIKQDSANDLAPLTEDAPNEIDWTNDDEVVRSAKPGSIFYAAPDYHEGVYIPHEKGKERVGSSWRNARINNPSVVAFENEHNPAFKFPASPVGELEGAFEAWKHYNFQKYFHHPDSDIRVAIAYAAWQYRAALSSKPAPEGIPEQIGYDIQPEHAERAESFLDSQISDWKSLPTIQQRMLVAHLAMAVVLEQRDTNSTAIISDKDAELQEFRGTDRIARYAVEEYKKSMLANLARAEAAERELAFLRASSAKVREEALREAMKIASSGIYNGDYPNGSTDSRDEVCLWISARILSLLPTSPESQEGKCS